VLRRILIRWAILGVGFALAAWLISGITISGGFWGYVKVAAIFGLVNALLGTILRILAFPITVATLGLFALVVNAALLALTAWLTDSLAIDGFWTAVLAALIIALVSVVLNRALLDRGR
jgi:putative membrane protein